MTRPFNTIATVAAALLGLVLLGLVLAAAFIPKEWVRRTVVAQLESRLKRPVRVETFDFAVFPRLRLDLEGVDVGGTAAPGAPHLAARSVGLGMRLLPLLQRRIEITSLEIREPRVVMLLESPEARAQRPPAPAAPSSTGTPVEMQVQSFRIDDGRVSIRLPEGTPFLEIAGLDEELSGGLSRSGEISLRGTTTVDSLRLHLASGGVIGDGLRLKLTKNLGYDTGAGVLALREATLDLAGVPVAITGQVSGLGGRPAAAAGTAGSPVGGSTGSAPEGSAGSSVGGSTGSAPASGAASPTLDLSLRGGPAEVDEIVGLLPSSLFPRREGMSSSGTLRLEGVVRGPATDADFRIDLALENGRIQDPALPQPVEGIVLRLSADPESVQVSEFAARVGESALRARATLFDYQRVPQFLVAADLEADLGAVAGFYAPPDSLELSGRATAQVIAEGRADRPDAVRFSGTARLAGVRAAGPNLPAPLEGLQGTVLFSEQTANLEDLRGRLGGSDFALSGVIRNLAALRPPARGPDGAVAAAAGRARMDLQLRSRRLDLDELFPDPNAGRNGAGGRRAVPPGPLPELPPIDGDVRISADQLIWRGINAADARGVVRIDRGIVTFDRLVFEAFDGATALSGRIDLTDRARPTFDIDAETRNVNVPAFFAYAKSLERFGRVGSYLAGRMNARAHLAGALTDSMALDPATLASQGSFGVTEAEMRDHPIQGAVASFLNAPQLRSLAFSDWTQTFRIEQGRLNIEGLSLRARGVELLADGWQAIDGTMEMRFDLILPPELTAGLQAKLPAAAAGALPAAPDGRVLVPLQLAGRIESPSISLDTGRLTAAAREQAAARLAAERARLEEEARRQAGRLLDRALGGAKADSADSVPPPRQRIEEEVKDRLGRILGGRK